VTISGNAIIQVIERWARKVVSSYFHRGRRGLIASGVQEWVSSVITPHSTQYRSFRRRRG